MRVFFGVPPPANPACIPVNASVVRYYSISTMFQDSLEAYQILIDLQPAEIQHFEGRIREDGLAGQG
jgi:hypothetical protein